MFKENQHMIEHARW